MLGRDQTNVSDDGKFVEWISKIYKTKPARIIPVEIGSARRNKDAFSEVMFADKKCALDGKIVRLERRLATKEMPSIFIRYAMAFGHGPWEIE